MSTRLLSCLFDSTARSNRQLAKELCRCWAKLDGRAAMIRRLIESRAIAHRAVGNAIGECGRLRAEIDQLERENQDMLFAFKVQIGSVTAFEKHEREAVARAFEKAKTP